MTMTMTLPLPSDVARQAAADALANVGVHEDGYTNSGKYVNQYLASVGLPPGNPWCAAFLYFRLITAAERAGEPIPRNLPRSGYTPDWKAWAKQNGWWVPVDEAKAGRFTPRKGDLCFFYFSTMGRIAHCGIVVEDAKAGSSSFTSVEGNTGSSEGVNRDGGGVWRKRRTFGSLGTGGGFIRMGDDPDGIGR